MIPASLHGNIQSIVNQMDVSLSGSYFSEKFSYVDEKGINDMCYVAFKVVSATRVDLVILSSTLTFISTDGCLKPDQIREISGH